MESIESNVEAKILAKGAGITLISKLGSRGLLLLVQIVLARLLGPAGFGLFTLGQVVLQIISQVGTLGLVSGVIRFGTTSWQLGRNPFSQMLRNVFSVTLVSSLIVGGGTFVLAQWIAVELLKRPELGNLLQAFAVAAVVLIWLNVLSAVTRISKRMEYSALALDLAPPLTSLILLGAVIYFFKLSVLSAVISVLLGYAAGAAISIVFVRRLYPDVQVAGPLSRNGIKDLLAYSIPNLFSGIFNIWLPNVTVLFLGYYLASKDVGIFQAAEQVSSLSAIVLLAFNTIFSPQISELYETQDHRKLNELFTISTIWGLYFSLPLLTVVLFMPARVMSVVFSDSYRSGGLLLVVMIVGQFINTATGAVGALLSMTHHQNRLLLRTATCFVLCIVLNIWLIPIWGTLGAALALAGSIALLNLLSLWDVRRLLSLWPYNRRYYKMGIALLVDVLVVFGVSRLWPESSFIQLAVTGVVSVISFGGVLLALGLEQYEVELFSLLRMRVNRMISDL